MIRLHWLPNAPPWRATALLLWAGSGDTEVKDDVPPSPTATCCCYWQVSNQESRDSASKFSVSSLPEISFKNRRGKNGKPVSNILKCSWYSGVALLTHSQSSEPLRATAKTRQPSVAGLRRHAPDKQKMEAGPQRRLSLHPHAARARRAEVRNPAPATPGGGHGTALHGTAHHRPRRGKASAPVRTRAWLGPQKPAPAPAPTRPCKTPFPAAAGRLPRAGAQARGGTAGRRPLPRAGGTRDGTHAAPPPAEAGAASRGPTGEPPSGSHGRPGRRRRPEDGAPKAPKHPPSRKARHRPAASTHGPPERSGGAASAQRPPAARGGPAGRAPGLAPPPPAPHSPAMAAAALPGPPAGCRPSCCGRRRGRAGAGGAAPGGPGGGAGGRRAGPRRFAAALPSPWEPGGVGGRRLCRLRSAGQPGRRCSWTARSRPAELAGRRPSRAQSVIPQVT